MSLYQNVSLLPEDPILGLTTEYNEDPRDEKVLLAVGIYREEETVNTRMQAVYEAEKRVIDTQPSKAYLPIHGNERYLQGTLQLLLGHELFQEKHAVTAKIQTIGGTGALRIGGDFLLHEVSNHIHLSSPTWANHHNVFLACGFQISSYPYYNNETKELYWDKFLTYLDQLSPKQVILLHACCHNPTGVDFNKEQWKKIAQIMKKKQLIAFFDIAYQGFAESLEEDNYAIRHFVEEGVYTLVACSHSKTFGLYGERVGGLFVFTESEDERTRVFQNLKKLVRGNYSNPPRHGAAIIDHILHNEELKQMWIQQLDGYRLRLNALRKQLINLLQVGNAKNNYRFLSNTNGLFCFTGLSKEQVIELREKHAIYMTLDGRMNVSGLNQENIQHVVSCMIEVGG